MALSDITLNEATSDVLARIGQTEAEVPGDGEIRAWLNRATFDIFSTLQTIVEKWYGHVEDVSVTAPAGITAVPLTGDYGLDKLSRPGKLIQSDGITPYDLVEFDRLERLLRNPNYDKSYLFAWYGASLYVFVGRSATALVADTSKFYFTRKPVAMVLASDFVDVPTEYVDIVINSATAKALGKLGASTRQAQLNQEVDDSLAKILLDFQTAVQVEVVEKPEGKQTPRQE